MLYDTVESKLHETLYGIFYHYTRQASFEMYSLLFDSCFTLADFIFLWNHGHRISEEERRELSTLYVMRLICDYINEYDDDEEPLRALNAVYKDGRFAEALPIIDKYLESKQGLLDTISEPSFKVNFERIPRRLEPS